WAAEAEAAVVNELRRKGAFTEEFVERTLSSIAGLGHSEHLDLVLVDLGGRRTRENLWVLGLVSHFLVLSSDAQEADRWIEFAGSAGCAHIGTLASELVHVADGAVDDGARSTLLRDGARVCGTLRNLTRAGPRDGYAAAIEELADWLIVRLVSPAFPT